MSSVDTSPTESADGTRRDRRRFLGTACLAVGAALSATSLAGCFDRREPSDPEAVEASLDALDGVGGYTADVGGDVRGQVRDETVTARVDGEHRVDETARRAHWVVEADDDREERYVDGDTVYEQCGFSRYVNVDDAWYPAETGVDWTEATLLGAQEILLEISEVYDRGTESRSDGETRVIEFAPDPDEYDRYQRRTGAADSDTPTPNEVAVTQRLVDDLPVLIRTDIERGSLFGPTVEEEVRYDVTCEPVSVELPPLVEDEDACPTP